MIGANRGSRKRRPLALRVMMALLAVALFAMAYQWGNQWQEAHQQPTAISGMLLRPPVAVADWQLATLAGDPVGSADLAGHWLLIGFASIDEANGQLAMARMIEVYNRLADQPRWREDLRLLLVTPVASAPGSVDFSRLLANAFVLTGAAEQRDALLAQLVGPRELAPADDQSPAPAGVALYLINPDGDLTALFPAGEPAVDIARDCRVLANRSVP